MSQTSLMTVRRLPMLFAALAAMALCVTPRLAAAEVDTPEEQLAAASALFDAQRFADAAVKLDAFLAANPKHAKAGAAALALARARAELKQYDKAIPAYEKAIATKDATIMPIAQLGLGEAAINARQFEKALPVLDAAAKSGALKQDQIATAYFWIGQANFETGKFQASQEAYDRVWREFPRVGFVDSAWYGSGVAALRQGKLDDARQRLRTVVDRYRTSDDRPRALLLLAEVDLQAKRYREARNGYEALLQGGGQPVPDDVKRAAEDGVVQVMLEMGDYAAAAPRLDAMISRLPANDPFRFRAQLHLGHARFRQKQYEPALAAYSEAAKATEENVAGEGAYWTANTYLAMNRSAEAAAQFAKVATRYPKHELAAKAQLKAGDAYLAAGQADAAANAYRVVLSKYPTSPQAADAKKAVGDAVSSISDPTQLAAALKGLAPAERGPGTIRLARLFIDKKMFESAIPPLIELLAASPEAGTAAEANYLLGLVYENAKQPNPQQAAAKLSEAVRLSPSAAWAADAQSRLAWLYLELKQAANAEKAANAALGMKLDPAVEQQTRLALVQAQLDQEKWDAALEGAKALTAGNPTPETTATVLFTQAWISEKKGKPEEALPFWEKIATEQPKSQYAPMALLKVGDSLLKAEKFEEARDKYSALVTGFPGNSAAFEARFKLGSALYNLGKPDEAAKEFDAVAAEKAAGGYQPEALYWAGVALDKAGKKTDAIQRLTKLVAQFPTHARIANAKVRLAALKAVAGG